MHLANRTGGKLSSFKNNSVLLGFCSENVFPILSNILFFLLKYDSSLFCVLSGMCKVDLQIFFLNLLTEKSLIETSKTFCTETCGQS